MVAGNYSIAGVWAFCTLIVIYMIYNTPPPRGGCCA